MADRDEFLNDPETMIRTALDGRQAQMWTALPCKVLTPISPLMTITAQPTIQGVVTEQDGSTSYVNLPVLVDVLVCFPSAGGFTLTLPIKTGDEVLVILASRCIDAWYQTGAIAPPMELRMHDLSDGFAIPGPHSVPNIVPAISLLNAQLRNNAGTTYLEITPLGHINVVAPLGFSVTGPATFTGAVSITGAVAVTGAVTATDEVTGNAIPLSTHTHPVTTAPGETGGPTP